MGKNKKRNKPVESVQPGQAFTVATIHDEVEIQRVAAEQASAHRAQYRAEQADVKAAEEQAVLSQALDNMALADPVGYYMVQNAALLSNAMLTLTQQVDVLIRYLVESNETKI